MNLTTFLADLAACNAQVIVNQVVTQTGLGIQTIQAGFLSELNTGQITFDCLLLIPPRFTQKNPHAEHREEEVRWFLIRQDKASGGWYNTAAERVAVWDSLISINDTLLKRLELLTNNSLPKYCFQSKVTVDRGYEGNLLEEKVVWIECSFILTFSDC